MIDGVDDAPAAAQTLFHSLRRLSGERRVRVLFLTRRPASTWRETARSAEADALFDWRPFVLGPLTGMDGHLVALSAMASAARIIHTRPPALTEKDYREWAERTPRHSLPLFQTALGVYLAMRPERPLAADRARDVMTAMVEHQEQRLRNVGAANGLDRALLPRLFALGAVSERLDPAGLVALSREAPDFGDIRAVAAVLENTPWWRDNRVVCPRPDIAAAVFTVIALEDPRAPAWLSAAIRIDPASGPHRLERLIHDSETVMGGKPRLSEWRRTMAATQ